MHLRLLVSRGGMNLARPGIGETGYMLSVPCETSGTYIRFWNTMMNAEENLWSISMYTITAVIYEEKKRTRANWWACILAGIFYYFLAWVCNLVEVGLFLWLSSTTRGDAYVFLVPVGILSLHRVLIGAWVEVRFLRRIASTLSNCKSSILTFNWFCLSARDLDLLVPIGWNLRSVC